VNFIVYSLFCSCHDFCVNLFAAKSVCSVNAEAADAGVHNLFVCTIYEAY